MSDHPEHPAPEELRPAPHGSDDFPADFFDDVAEPSPLATNPLPAYDDRGLDPSPIADSALRVEMHEQSVAADQTARAVETRPHSVARQYPSLPVTEAPPGAPLFPIVMGILMVGAIVAAVLVTKNQPTTTTTAAPAAANAAAADPKSTPETAFSASSAMITGDVKDLKGQLDALGGQLKGLVAKVDGLPKSPEPLDLAPVQGKIEELSKSAGTVVALSEKVVKLDERLGGIDGTIKAVNEKVAALSDELKKVAEAPKTAPLVTATAEAVKPEADKTAAGLTEGAELFKAGKYKEASEVFKKLEAADAKDARVYYYAALSNGLSTNIWKDETLKSAAKGAELEKAGVTKPEDVDATFNDLPVTLKPWLTFFRKAAK